MAELYECSRCGVVSEAVEQVCQPHPLREKREYCGTAPERGTLCENIKAQLPYVCAKCGRPAEQAELVCDPLVLG
ncbi:hypothetical protein DESUT3_10560 [Desulfuromonas versatilis]|uniref:Uncharacterized protein n=1 Tax=Desulfuromonas versatilis TaxID=2802975 RepID=A0ABN6DVD0_9BACT|nr:hypothetical protein [Desulfuromonas versatilis]BCR03987.1 hypothetical protein DESUT3_10560 [Desulfuromonas versatilis]